MAYLTSIVENINAQLKNKLLVFPTAEFLGIAYPIARQSDKPNVFVPALINSSGECSILDITDLVPLRAYHKISTSTYSQVKTQSYGDSYDLFQHSYEVDLIVQGRRNNLQTTPDELEAAIASNIPSKVTLLGAEYVNIVTVSANHNSRSLFSQEYPGLDYFINPEYIFFSIRYRVELRYQKGCLSLCQCN